MFEGYSYPSEAALCLHVGMFCVLSLHTDNTNALAITDLGLSHAPSLDQQWGGGRAGDDLGTFGLFVKQALPIN